MCLTELITVEHHDKSPKLDYCKMCAMCHLVTDPAERCDICKAKQFKNKGKKKWK